MWTASYRGGWQLAAPNAGASCRVGDVEHGFHGRASNDPWEVLASEPSTASFEWRGHGLSLVRTFELTGSEVLARLHVEALEPTSLVALEHVALGLELLEPEVEIELPAGLAYELSEADGPPFPPPAAPRWPSRPAPRRLAGARRSLAARPSAKPPARGRGAPGRACAGPQRENRHDRRAQLGRELAAAPLDLARDPRVRRAVARSGGAPRDRADVGSAPSRPRRRDRARPGAAARAGRNGRL